MENLDQSRASSSASHRVVIVSPCRDEADTLERTIASMEAQTHQPVRWIVVDDGSSDDTPRLLAAAAERIPWLHIVRRENRGFRKVGGGVIEAFDAGRATLDLPFDFIAKMDMDLEFGPRYLERALEYFAEDTNRAALSGQIHMHRNGEVVEEFSMVPEAVAGCFKLYRRTALEEIGGFVQAVMWDGIDIHKCRIHGFKTINVPDVLLRIIHLRPMGASDRSIYRGRLRWGEGQWFMGSIFPYLLASGVNRMRERPFLIGGLLIIVGYLKAAILRRARFEDPGFRRSLRQWQWRRLISLVGGRTQ
ncbi:MAG: glycosyltransferase [bacterium]|nr:glycosyltransferase [bacterium]